MKMKRIFLISSLLLLPRIFNAQEEPFVYEISGLTTAQALIGFSDSLRISYPYHRIERILFDSTVNQVIYRVYPNRISVIIPYVRDEITVNSIFGVIDSIARTDIYTNKVIVRSISGWMANLGNIDYDWLKEIAIRASLLDLEYSARFVSSPAVRNLPKDLYTPEILNKIRKIFGSPFLTREEAEIIAQNRKPLVMPDTTGYFELKEKALARTLNEDEDRRYWFLRNEMARANNRGQTIEQYNDSLERVLHEFEVNRFYGKLWDGYSNIISDAGIRRIYSLAHLIDSFATSEMRQIMRLTNVDDILARLKYKDYQQQLEKKYMNEIDSCIMYLNNNPDLHPENVLQIYLDMVKIWDRLVYIDTENIYSKMARMLMITNKMLPEQHWRSDNVIVYSVGAYFLAWKLSREIVNLPIPDGMPLWEWDENDIPTKVYQWMMENMDNIILRSYSYDD